MGASQGGAGAVGYRLALRPSARRDLAKLPIAVRRRLASSINALASNPRGRNTKSLKGTLKGLMSLRLGAYRVLYIIDDAQRVVEILRAGTRANLYKRET